MTEIVFRRGGLTLARGPQRVRVTVRQPLWQPLATGALLMVLLSAFAQWLSLSLGLSLDLWLMAISMAPVAAMLVAWMLWRRRSTLELTADAMRLTVVSALGSHTRSWATADVLHVSSSGPELRAQLKNGASTLLLGGPLDPAAVAEAAQAVEGFRSSK